MPYREGVESGLYILRLPAGIGRNRNNYSYEKILKCYDFCQMISENG